MNIWALADLHLALTLPDKDMAFFGPSWKDYTKKMEENWSNFSDGNRRTHNKSSRI